MANDMELVIEKRLNLVSGKVETFVYTVDKEFNFCSKEVKLDIPDEEAPEMTFHF